MLRANERPASYLAIFSDLSDGKGACIRKASVIGYWGRRRRVFAAAAYEQSCEKGKR
ncbi:hypothetical protein GCM10027430_29200 [Lysobacter tyrosinilyticus]